MDLTIEPEIYSPVLSDTGEYIDSCPGFIKHGIRCPCGSRNDHVYDTKLKFKQHINTIKHKKWVDMLSKDKENHYKENIKLKDTIKNQREIIGQQGNEISRLQTLNKYLDAKLFRNEFVYSANTTTADLLDLDM